VRTILVKPKILRSYESFSKALVLLGFRKPSKAEYKQALKEWLRAENSRIKQTELNGVLKK
jgi:hypothetical protein